MLRFTGRGFDLDADLGLGGDFDLDPDLVPAWPLSGVERGVRGLQKVSVKL